MTGNVASGVVVDGSGSTLTLSKCQVTGNGGNGVRANASNRADLGDPNPMPINPGGNVLHPNVQANVCNLTGTGLSAEHNHWSACGPTEVAVCNLAGDVAPIPPNVDTFDCFTP